MGIKPGKRWREGIMSSACTCHIDPEFCWWCLYEKEKEKTKRYEKAISDIKNLCLDYRSGSVGDISDSFLVDCVLNILRKEDIELVAEESDRTKNTDLSRFNNV